MPPTVDRLSRLTSANPAAWCAADRPSPSAAVEQVTVMPAVPAPSPREAPPRETPSRRAPSPTAMSPEGSVPAGVDVRGPRFAAWVSSAVLVAVLLVSAVSVPAAAVLAAAQAVVFALGAALGPRRSPYGLLFARFVAPRLGPVAEREPVPPLRFAQGVGLAFAAVGAVGFALGVPVVGAVAVGAALVAALLNAAFGICLGCLLHPFALRLLGR